MRRPAPKAPPAVEGKGEEEDEPLLSFGADLDDSGDAAKLRSRLRFVEARWFQIVVAVLIIANTALIALEVEQPEKGVSFYAFDQVILAFYVFELLCRVGFWQRDMVCGDVSVVAWNCFDCAIVVAGVLSQWVFPALAPRGLESLQVALHSCRVLRVLRLVRLLQCFLDSDLSWADSSRFQSFVGAAIFLNALLMGMETDIKWQGWSIIEQVLLSIYVFELLVGFKRAGLFFLSCSNPDVHWNLLDFIIVLTSTIDSWVVPMVGLVQMELSGAAGSAERANPGLSLGQAMVLLRMLRLMRILRLIKLVKSVRPLYILVTSVLAAMQGVSWVLVLTIVVLYAMGIMATRLVGHGIIFTDGVDAPDFILEPFKTVPDSMFTLFRVMSGAESEAEAQAIDSLMDTMPTVKFAFVFFMITSSWTLLSILTAVVSENMITTTGQQELELKIQSAEEDRARHIKELKELFSSIDASGDGLVKEHEIIEFLADKKNASNTARRCRLPVRNVMEVLQTLGYDGQDVNMEQFVECMAEVSNPVTEKSIMKLEARMMSIERHARAQCEKFHGEANAHSSRLEASLRTQQAAIDKLMQCFEAAAGSSTEKQRAAVEGFAEVLGNLCATERRSREELFLLRESVELLLNRQDELQEQTLQAVGLINKLEAKVSSMDRGFGDGLNLVQDALRANEEAIFGVRAAMQGMAERMKEPATPRRLSQPPVDAGAAREQPAPRPTASASDNFSSEVASAVVGTDCEEQAIELDGASDCLAAEAASRPG